MFVDLTGKKRNPFMAPMVNVQESSGAMWSWL